MWDNHKPLKEKQEGILHMFDGPVASGYAKEKKKEAKTRFPIK